MKNLFETKEWNRDNLRLICGDLYACMNGQQWVLLWDEVDGDNEITDLNSLRFRSRDSTYTMYIMDDRRVKVYKDFEFLRYITFDEMVDRTYSKYFNKKKTLNEIRKEHGFEEIVTREATDDEPLSLREMVQPLLDELRDAERYAWNKYIDDFEAKWNHDMLKAHLNEKLVNDNVNAPDHYKLRGLDIEAIDVIRGALTEDEFRGFCKGNVLKYTIREAHKNGDEDLKKAKKYLEFLEEDDSDE